MGKVLESSAIRMMGRTGREGVAEVCGVVAVVPLAVSGLDLLALGADEALLPADAAVGEAGALDVHHRGGGRGLLLVGGVEAGAVLVEGVVAVAGLAVLEGDASLCCRRCGCVRRWVLGGVGGAVGRAVVGGWLIGVWSM